MSYDYLFDFYPRRDIMSFEKEKMARSKAVLTPADRSQPLLPVTIMGYSAPRKPWRFETVSNASETPDL